MALNHKRRIFRSDTRVSLLFGHGMMLAGLCCLTTLLAAGWQFTRPSDTPPLASAKPTAERHLTAMADRAAVIDGDTLRLGDDIVRLAGVVAPSRGSVCRTGSGVEQDCGSAAANTLAALVRGAPVVCTILGQDSTGRPVGACRANDVALSEALVRQGWARVSVTDAGAALRAAEATAQAGHLGIWQSNNAPLRDRG